MGTIDGINPIIVDNIKVSTQKPAINKTQRSKISEEKKDRDKKRKPSQSHWKLKDLEAAVEKLNRLLLADKISLYFRIIINDSKVKVRLISADHQKIISELSPERVLEMALKFDTRGFTVNELI